MRSLLAIVLFVAFGLQSYVTQTHIHLPPSAVAAFSVGHVGVSSAKPVEKDKHPGDEDPAHCPLCQAVAASGSFVMPVLPVLLLPVFSSAIAEAASYLPIIVSPLSHDWRGRGPPRR